MPQTAVSAGKIQKKSKKKKQKQVRRSVLRMLRVMESTGETPQDAVSEFLGTGRTGRRNALPDILGQNAQTSCSDLPDRLQSLCSVSPESGPSQSGASSDPSRTASVSSAPSSAATAPSRPPAAEGAS